MDTRAVFAATILAAAVCFGAGVLFGKRSGDPHTADPARPAPSAVTALLRGNATSDRAAKDLSRLARSSEHGLFEKYRGYFRLISDAGPEDMAALVAMISREVPEDLGGDELLAAAALHWATIDPLGALDALLALEPPMLEEVDHVIVGVLAEREPRAAWRALMGFDEEGGVVVGGALTSADFRNRAMGWLLQDMAEYYPELTVELMTSIETRGMYRSAIMDGVRALAAENPSLALEAVGKLPRGFMFGSDVYESVFREFAERDRAGAIAALEELSRTDRDQAVGGISDHWADDDPAAALAWLAGLPPGMNNGTVMIDVYDKLVVDDRAAAAAVLNELPSPSLRAALAPLLIGEWLEDDTAAALAWSRDTLEGRPRERALEKILAKGVDLELAVQRELAESLPNAEGARRKFVHRWSDDDPAAAAAWAVAQEADAETLLSSVGGNWPRDDLEGLTRFTRSLPAGPLRDIAQDVIDNPGRRRWR